MDRSIESKKTTKSPLGKDDLIPILSTVAMLSGVLTDKGIVLWH
jgi:hypothetical protein